MKFAILFLIVSRTVSAKINGEFYSEFKRKDMDCAIQSKITQKNENEIKFFNWDELCEDAKGNDFESSLQDVTTYKKIGDKKLEVVQGKDSVKLDAIETTFESDHVHYHFIVDTEDGKLEINEEYKLNGDNLNFSSVYILEGQEIINKSGTVGKKK